MKKFFSRKITLAMVAVLALAGIVYSQTSIQEIEGILQFRSSAPQIRAVSTVAFLDRLGTSPQSVSFARPYVTASSGSTTLTISQSNGIAVNTGTSSTTEFILPLASNQGLNYCFVENGDAGGELLVGVQTGDNVVGHGITDTAGTGGSTAIATSADHGIKNTAATNVKGDFTCLTADGTTTWVMTSVMGIWATR